MTDKQFAKDVAKELDRRHRRRKVLVLGGGATAIVLAMLYLRCGGGWGLGKGGGSGAGSGPGSGAVVTAKHCEIRVAKDGITVDNRTAKIEDVVTTCKKSGAADVVVTGDAREGDWEQLRAALEAAKVVISLRSPR
ncbi:MAG: hypothetical protein QM831_12750 [Kofleriaceae bacterium]